MQREGFTAREAMGWLRIMRPGSVIGVQQRYLCIMEAISSKADSAQAATTAASGGTGDTSPGVADAGAEGGVDSGAESCAEDCARQLTRCGRRNRRGPFPSYPAARACRTQRVPFAPRPQLDAGRRRAGSAAMSSRAALQSHGRPGPPVARGRVGGFASRRRRTRAARFRGSAASPSYLRLLSVSEGEPAAAKLRVTQPEGLRALLASRGLRYAALRPLGVSGLRVRFGPPGADIQTDIRVQTDIWRRTEHGMATAMQRCVPSDSGRVGRQRANAV